MTRDMLRRRANLLSMIVRALDKRCVAVTWGEGERMNYTRMLRELGVDLVTETGAKKRGHRLKRGAAPVACAYYGAPIQAHCDLYVFGVQTSEVADAG